MAARDRTFRVVVAGAGPVGLLFALRLIRQTEPGAVTVRVVDAGAPARWTAGAQTDLRVYALSRESQFLFGEQWAAMQRGRVSPYGAMRVFEGDEPFGPRSIGFDAADIGEPDLGHIVEDSLIRMVLLDGLTAAGVEASFGVSVREILPGDGGVRVTTTADEVLVADLVVGADGGESVVRQAVGIDVFERDYGQRAIVAHVETERPHAQTAWQRFLPDGPLAFLPLADGRSSIVWSQSVAEASRRLALGDAEFLAELQVASANVLGAIRATSARRAFPLRLRHALGYTRPGIALIGDAAHTVHPLAGQGMNLGLRDAAVLVDTLRRALAAGEYPADEFVLRRYARAQKAHNLGMQLTFDAINALFGAELPPWLRPLRGLGLGAVDRAGPVKRLLIRRALGLDRADAREYAWV